MGVAKAALEATVRYLAADLGPQGIRVNAISAGPIRTLAACGISGFRDVPEEFAGRHPLRRATSRSTTSVRWQRSSASDGAAAITGETLYVDSGYNIMAMSTEDEG